MRVPVSVVVVVVAHTVAQVEHASHCRKTGGKEKVLFYFLMTRWEKIGKREMFFTTCVEKE